MDQADDFDIGDLCRAVFQGAVSDLADALSLRENHSAAWRARDSHHRWRLPCFDS